MFKQDMDRWQEDIVKNGCIYYVQLVINYYNAVKYI